MSKKKKKVKKEFTPDFEEAWEILDAPVQCGECYNFYDPKENDFCPVCDSDEWVGDR